MTFNSANKSIRLDRWNTVKIQLLIHCFVNNIHLSDQDISCVALLALLGEQTLENFCSIATGKNIFTSNQSVRNTLAKVHKKNLIVKKGHNRKKIFLNPELDIVTSGNIMLDYKLIYFQREPQVV